MSETESKHDNRSAFGDETTDPHAFARNHPIAPVFGIGVNSATSGDPLWSQTIHQCTARALTAALADALGIELHPAGTAARLSAERSQLLPPRRLRVPPVYRGLPPDVLECLYHTLCRRTYPSEVRNKAFDIMYERDLMDHYTGDLTDDGWGDLTAIEHPEGREHVETADAEALHKAVADAQAAVKAADAEWQNQRDLVAEVRGRINVLEPQIDRFGAAGAEDGYPGGGVRSGSCLVLSTLQCPLTSEQREAALAEARGDLASLREKEAAIADEVAKALQTRTEADARAREAAEAAQAADRAESAWAGYEQRRRDLERAVGEAGKAIEVAQRAQRRGD